MFWSEKIEKALYTAAKLHEGIYRKGPDHLPSLVHLVAVAALVSEHTDDEDVVVSALLHDTIEDTTYTTNDLANDFGERVMGFVLGVTIPEAAETTEVGGWGRDRRRYFENLRVAPQQSALIAAADKIHNFTTVMRDYADNPEGFRRDFPGTKEDRLNVYGAIVELIRDKLRPEHPLSVRLNQVWRLYEKFVTDMLARA